MADRRRRKKKKDYTLYVAVSSAIVLFAVVFVFMARGIGGDSDQKPQTDKPASVPAALTVSSDKTQTATQSAATDSAKDTTDAPDASSAESDSETEKPQTEAPVTTSPSTQSAPDTSAPEETTPAAIDTTGGGVPYSGPAELSVISNSVFIGDSRTEGLKIYTSILSSGARVYANKGLAVNTIRDSAFVETSAGTVTAIDAMRYDPDFDSAYIALGINELAWGSLDSYIQKFGDLVTTVLEINPSATVYIEAILPVTQTRSASDEIFNNPRIAEFNVRLRALAESLGVRFLDVTEMFAYNGGALPEEASGDGIHLNKEYCEKWLDYIIEHRA